MDDPPEKEIKMFCFLKGEQIKRIICNFTEWDKSYDNEPQASEYQTTTVVESLINQGSGVNSKDEQGITPLMQVLQTM